MNIYSEEPLQALWEIVKPLRDEIPIYKESMAEDINSTPPSYLVIREVTDGARLYGDGNCELRTADCDIILVSKGQADSSTDLHNINKEKVRKRLREERLSYTGYNLGYDDVLKSTQYTWNVKVLYG